MAETETERARDRSDQPGESPAEYLDRYGRMRLIRRFEEEIQRLFLKGEVHGTTHLSAGQEAVPVGVCSALEPDDYVGGSIAAATGAAISAQRQGKVAVAFFGDGASNQGYFHECLNWAQVFDLPVVYVCENNFYGEFTPMASVTAGGDIGIRAASFGMQSQVVDGNDLWAVREAALEAVGRARGGDGPTLLECQTYRHYGHSKSDPGKYRPPDEVERWLGRDPLDLTRARLLDLGLTSEELAAKEAEIDAQMDRAVEGALAAPYPDPETAGGTEYRE